MIFKPDKQGVFKCRVCGYKTKVYIDFQEHVLAHLKSNRKELTDEK